MPHVKGNKFKPKPAEEAPKEEEPVPAAQAQPPADGTSAGQSKKKRKKNKGQAAQHPAAEQATQAAVPLAAADQASEPPAAKKRRRGGQPPQLVLPALPTVVAPAPKPGTAPAAAAAVATSNWASLKAAMDAAKQQAEGSQPHWRRKRQREKEAAAGKGAQGGVQDAVPENRPQSIGKDTEATKVVAIDCEMVGVGPGGEQSALARVCVVNSAGNVLLDRFVRPKERVTDFRTKFSGVRPSDLREAAPFDEVQRQVSQLLQGRIVVGHAIENDLEALLLTHRRKDVRDTAKYPPLMKAQGRTGKLKPRALRHLAAEHLGLTIQAGEHSPMDDARAALYLYLRFRKDWERWLAAGGKRDQHPAVPAMLGAAGVGMGAAHGGKKRAQPVSLHELAKNDYLADL